MITRIVTVAFIRNTPGQYLLCRMPENHGVYPGQWGLVGGGLENGETIEEAIRREVQEEIGLELREITQLFFSDDRRVKKLRDGGTEEQYLVYLYFAGVAEGEITLCDEWSEYAWVNEEEIHGMDLNTKTRQAFVSLGVLP